MKLRLQKGSIRFRLKDEEIKTLKDVGEFYENVGLTASGEGISYLLTIEETGNVIRLHFNKDVIQILVPRERLDLWIDNGEVGIQETLDFGHNENLTVIIEKDLTRGGKRKANKI